MVSSGQMNAAFLQFGAVGAVALLALTAVRILFQREIKAHEAETVRADRLEAELKRLNETVQTQYLTTLAEATLAMSQAFNLIREDGHVHRQQQQYSRRKSPHQDQ